ncbi:VOC family protein [Streptomyces sp. TRM 70351]|uniref:VOC family protein n=1 Tax=Streptomyces sp. TRM 70351 TaxID=3116552 RepID=UPI002E7BB954|nr:VOC family protein [Streptomyces sp. TRM 70351]MEE1928642.1 VOC family protein [Streptomyces sp. TRM 70351]
MLSTAFVPGAPVWIDLGSRDVAASAGFYRRLFGWAFRPAGPDAGGYGFFESAGRVVAAAGPLRDGGDPAWTVYFHTEDADATARVVEAAGGEVRAEPAEVFTAGRAATFADPTGAAFAVWEQGERLGLDVVDAPGALCWTELYSTDAVAARDFYAAVFGWEFTDVPMPGTTYCVAAPAGAGDAGAHAGLMTLLPENLAAGSGSEWHPYVAVEDCDAVWAEAVAGGAEELFGPMDVPGNGRLAMFRDPQGAVCAIRTGQRA